MKEAVNPAETALNLVLGDDLVDLLDCGAACIPHCLSVRSPESSHELTQTRVGHHREVRAGVTCIDLRASRAFEHSNRLPRRLQKICGAQTGQACAHNERIDGDVSFQFGEGRERGRVGPVRQGSGIRSRTLRHESDIEANARPPWISRGVLH